MRLPFCTCYFYLSSRLNSASHIIYLCFDLSSLFLMGNATKLSVGIRTNTCIMSKQLTFTYKVRVIRLDLEIVNPMFALLPSNCFE